MECIRGQVRWSGMHARTLVSECYSQLASISHEAHHSQARECQGEGNHQRAFRSFPQHKLREKCMQAEVCYHMRRGGRKSTKPKSSTSSRFGARCPSAQRVLEAVRSRFERPFAALDRRSTVDLGELRQGTLPTPSAAASQRFAALRPPFHHGGAGDTHHRCGAAAESRRHDVHVHAGRVTRLSSMAPSPFPSEQRGGRRH